MDGSDNVEHCGVSEKSLNDFKRELYEESQKIREEMKGKFLLPDVFIKMESCTYLCMVADILN